MRSNEQPKTSWPFGPVYAAWSMFKGPQGMSLASTVILNHFFLQPVEDLPNMSLHKIFKIFGFGWFIVGWVLAS